MRKKLLVGMVAAVMGFATACEELNEVVPSGSTQKLEETSVPEQTSTEKETTSTEEGEGEKVEEAAVASGNITKYVIREGEQHATLTYQKTQTGMLKFKALFDSTAIYQTAQETNQGDINKLYGVSDCNSYHHTNSARFGWRWYEDQLEIWAYTYINGERNFALLDTVGIGTFNQYEIAFKENKYVFRLNDKELEMPRSCQAVAEGYKLFPYFGGDESAPHDISIWIEELED